MYAKEVVAAQRRDPNDLVAAPGLLQTGSGVSVAGEGDTREEERSDDDDDDLSRPVHHSEADRAEFERWEAESD